MTQKHNVDRTDNAELKLKDGLIVEERVREGGNIQIAEELKQAIGMVAAERRETAKEKARADFAEMKLQLSEEARLNYVRTLDKMLNVFGGKRQLSNGEELAGPAKELRQ